MLLVPIAIYHDIIGDANDTRHIFKHLIYLLVEDI